MLTLFAVPLTPGELAAHEKVQPPSMTRLVASLEAAGVATRAPHPTDGRQVLVAVAPGQEERLEALAAEHRVPAQRVGATGGDALALSVPGGDELAVPVAELREASERTLRDAFA